MSLGDLASLASLASGLAVLVSLVYLGRQVRQSTKHTRAAIGQNRIARLVDLSLRQIDPVMAEIVWRGRSGDEAMTPGDVSRFMAYARAQFWSAEDDFIQYRAGLLPRPMLASFRASFTGLMRGPGMQAAWEILRPNFDPDFAAFMDGIARNAEAAGFFDAPQQWEASVARHKATQASPVAAAGPAASEPTVHS